MRDLDRAIEGLRDQLAGTQREISVLEQLGRELTAMSQRCDAALLERMLRRYLDETAERMALALDRQKAVRRMMEECGGERRKLRVSRAAPVRRPARRSLSSAWPIAIRTRSP